MSNEEILNSTFVIRHSSFSLLWRYREMMVVALENDGPVTFVVEM